MAVFVVAARAQPVACNAPASSPSVTVGLPAHPFAVTQSRDGCWVFVSLKGDDSGRNVSIAILKRGGGHVELSRVVPLESPPTLKDTFAGMVLTHDGKLLIAGVGSAVFFLDVQRMTDGDVNPLLGSIQEERDTNNVYVNVTRDDKLLFVSQEAVRSIAVIDLERARGNGYKAGAILGKIPTGNLPIALTFSPDNKWLYTTSEVALVDWNWPKVCKPEGRDPANLEITNPEGAVIVVDVQKARTDPAHSVAGRVPAGCSPVRLAISPDGGRLYVTARNSNAILAFDTTRLLSDVRNARLATVSVGAAPVPIAVVDRGAKVIAGNSNRFAGANAPQVLSVMDAARIPEGAAALLGTIPAGAFPRDMSVSGDGHTLFLTNFGSNSLQVIDLGRLPIVANREQ